MTDVNNLLLAGVGGQGAVLAAKILGIALLAEKYDVKVSEVHGMAQRGGSIVTQIRYGTEVYAPTITPGEAHFLVAFEALEAMRWVHYLLPEGLLISDTAQIAPLEVTLGGRDYPDVQAKLKARNPHWIPALVIARELGNWRTANVVLIGYLSRFLPVTDQTWDQSLTEVIKPAFLQDNKTAFQAGKNFLI